VSLERRLEKLEGLASLEPPQDDAKARRHEEIRAALNERASLLWREGEAIKNRTAALQEQGHSQFDAQLIAKDEIVRSSNPSLADFFDSSYPPEIRHDAIAKHRWLADYIESRKRGNFA
jgi:hypothetical protein